MSDSPYSANIMEKLAEQSRKAAEQAMAASQEFVKQITSLGAGGVPDTEGLIAAHKRNLEALTAANKVAMDGAQAVARRHLEILQQTSLEVGETIKAITQAEGPQAKASVQTDRLKLAYEQAIANVRELRDLISRSNGEALEVLNRRFLESLDELKSVVEKTAQKE